MTRYEAMGNSSSQAVRPAEWTHSCPRPQQVKVLPERVPGQRLRVTDNGAILHNGGTISGRHSSHKGPYRPRSTSVHQQPQPGLGKRFGSEPDLRGPEPHHNYSDSPSKQRINNRSRKKYKAPAPPPGDSSSPDSYQWDINGVDTLDPPARRMRLFKTRAQQSKRSLGGAHRAPDDDVRPLQNGFHHPPPPHKPPLLRSLSSPEFQAELLQAAQRLRPLSAEGNRMNSPKVELGAHRGQGSGRESPPGPTSAPELPPRRKSAHEMRKPPQKHWEVLSPVWSRSDRRDHRDVPSKTFYFGMEQGEREVVEKFAASLQRIPPTPAPAANTITTSGSGGSLSSDEDADEDVGGIALQLRPTLPKKQPEIPRFSPTAAWRLLSALDSAQSSIPSTEETPVLLEERIQRLSRPVAPPLPQVQQAPRSSHDKSGDSGISGDASPGGLHEDSSEALLASPPSHKTNQAHPSRPLVAWTPQQDLEGEEESSSDGGVDTQHHILGIQPKFSPRSHVFSLSLPRDDRLCLAMYSENDEMLGIKSRLRNDVHPPFNNLQKFKRSLGNALGSKGHDEREQLDGNWLLSRSVPNSLNNGHISSSSSPSSPDNEEEIIKRTPFSYLATGGHVMYLPQYGTQSSNTDQSLPRGRTYSGGTTLRNLQSTFQLSKSCENISANEMRQIGRTPSPETIEIRSGRNRVENMQSLQHENDLQKDDSNPKRGKAKRFTFQSTVRQIERRRLAEKLSREAELKERQRLSELEAMRQVEEEFQRKRAREKANIRQQLRLFSMDEQLYSSLPTGWGDGTRAEPDGAADSSAPSPASQSPSAISSKTSATRQVSGSSTEVVKATSTQILSEFREARREYREYRQSNRYHDSGPDSVNHLDNKRATVHPQVVYDMPKNTQVYVTQHQINGGTEHERTPSDNYRRDFAHGTKPGRSAASSDSDVSQPNARTYAHQNPVKIRLQRSRSASPDLGHSCSSDCASAMVETQELVVSPQPSEEVEETSEPSPIEVTPTRLDDRNRFSFTSLQPFVRNQKSYRPIVFNPGSQSSSSHKVAQPVN